MGEMHDLYGSWEEGEPNLVFDNEPPETSPTGELAAVYARWESGEYLNDDEFRVIVRAASKKVAHALKSGRLVKSDVCERCGNADTLQAHHHRGYRREHWLDVRWLCWRCHYEQRHGEPYQQDRAAGDPRPLSRTVLLPPTPPLPAWNGGRGVGVSAVRL
ncbi:MAG: hypothetical protein ACRDZT_08465 [Acidimicrobiales bacterium]